MLMVGNFKCKEGFKKLSLVVSEGVGWKETRWRQRHLSCFIRKWKLGYLPKKNLENNPIH